jgi:glycosyltransferase involved in cell wall biosynthesis
MPDNQPILVSVIMPALNVAAFIEEAIDSVIRQNVSNIELLIVDDESVDETTTIVNDKISQYGSQIRLIEQKHQGVSAARNTALQVARGRYIAFLDSDDIWPDDMLAYHLGFLSQNDHECGVRGLISSFKLANESEQFDPSKASPPFRCTQLGPTVVRRDVFDRLGMFDTTLTYGEDTDWFLRASEAGITLVDSERLSLYYRRRTGSLTDRENSSKLTLFGVLKKTIDRKKAQKAIAGDSQCSTSPLQ